jgi:urease gamma subunit
MSENEARDVLSGILPMPEEVTVEAVFHDAHVVVTVPTPF